MTTKKKATLLLDLKINNPIIYFQDWWKKIIDNEGIDFKVKVHPLTAITIAMCIAAGSFGLGRFTLPPNSPIIKYVPQLAPTPTPNVWKDTAFTGTLMYSQSTKKYYLTTIDAQAINLEIPGNVDLTTVTGKRIFASGLFNSQTNVSKITDSASLEILPTRVVKVPILSTPTPTPQD